MKKKIFSTIACIVILSSTVMYAQDWLTTGNTLGVTGTFGSVDNKKIEFISHNKKRGILTNDGLWGFGNTNPLAQVHINSTDNTRNPLQIDVLDSLKMVVTKEGRVSIGITAPDVRLHIVGGSDVSLGGGGTIVMGAVTSTNLALDNNEIQSRNNGAAGTLFLNKGGGDVNIGSGGLFLKSPGNFVGIGTTAPAVRLNVDGGTTVALNHGGYIVAGATNAFNLAIDNGAIQARNNGAASLLNLNKDGGDVNISRGALFVDASNNFVGIGAVPSAQFHVVLGKDATLTDGGYIVAGPTSFNNIVIDAHGIQARNNGQAQVLNLNPLGGTIYTSGYLQTGSLVLNESMIDFGVGRGPGFRVDFNNNSIKILGNFRPTDDALWNLDSSFKRWTEVWAVDGSINTSDLRDKKNIRDLSYGLKEVMQLRPVKFNWKNSNNQNDKLGLIAQDLQKVLPEVVRDYEYKIDSTGKKEKVPAARLGVMYADIIPVLIKAIQEQQQMITDQDKNIRTLTQLVNQLTANQSNAETLNATTAKTTALITDASLEQNAPNPFTQNTVINYYAPQNISNAFININDVNGRLVKTVAIRAKGKGQLILQAGELAAGTYQYALVVNGKLVDAKKMVLMK